jgi:hypothetical protein
MILLQIVEIVCGIINVKNIKDYKKVIMMIAVYLFQLLNINLVYQNGINYIK